MTLSEEQRELLSAYGIHGKSQDISILDYPKIAAWFKGDNGQKFLMGEKGVILLGGWEATKIGYSIMRWLTLTDGKTAIMSLHKFAFAEELEDKINEHYLLIKSFQNEYEKCPLNEENISNVEEIVMQRYDENKPTILICYYGDLSWYSSEFKEFINDCYLVIDVQRT